MITPFPLKYYVYTHISNIYQQVHRKHLLPDTLIAYQLPWDWDEVSINPNPGTPHST